METMTHLHTLILLHFIVEHHNERKACTTHQPPHPHVTRWGDPSSISYHHSALLGWSD